MADVKVNPAPLLIGAAQMVIVASTLVYTPKSSPLRLITVAATLFLGYQHYTSCRTFTTSGLWNGTSAATNIIYVLHHIDLLLLKRVNGDDLAPHNTKPNSTSNPFFTALRLCFSTRSVRTKFQLSHVPSFPPYFRNRAAPARIPFLYRTALIFIWQYVLLDLADTSMASQPTSTPGPYGDADEYLNPLQASREQNLTRLGTSVVGSFIAGRIIMDFVYRGMALIAVGLGVSEPADWPPFFGRMQDSYTIRTFWGRFWHQWLRGPLSAMSVLTVKRLRLPGGKVAMVLVMFALSAAVHVANDVVAEKGVAMGTVWQFMGFAAAMVAEDMVQTGWRRAFGPSARKDAESKEKPRAAAWKLMLGYLWVQVVLFTVVPWYLYPSGRMPAGSMWTVPYSVVEIVGVKNAGIFVAGLGTYILAFLGPEI
jgi:hypothetical protein